MEAAVEQLLEWTAPQGVVLNGIYPMELAGRGIGIVSTRRLEVKNVSLLDILTELVNIISSEI